MHARHPSRPGRPSVPALLVLAVGLFTGGCHRHAYAPLNPRAEIAVKVENQNFLDMDVFIVRSGGDRIRIGMVPGISTHIFMVRPDLIGNTGDVQFEVHPIGGRANSMGERITVRPGDVIQLTIPPS